MAMRSASAGPRSYRQLGVITASPLGLAAAVERMRGKDIEFSAIDLSCGGAAAQQYQGRCWCWPWFRGHCLRFCRYQHLFGATELVYFVIDARRPLDHLEVVEDELRALRAVEELEDVPFALVASHGDGPGAEFIRDFICDRLRLPQDQVSV
ncbi:hypothetical protein B0T26DRAFT_756128 [Lasiosphaeria miniovina]|uniref:Uncharacterized protein n=1 Tax=Lasiosphaeria miniovina TaxID=1954250 RepID=A0AA39ZZW9_9PEZI|nr:uncharacterized protein B0T26DRAFT_756128 [Lasiosphaeria miniovina]KAK0706650.1 hypothetical protein B0T26DRAFT_756128 [Lasiosphaeria miniovina]